MSKTRQKRSQEGERKYRSSRERHRAYRAKGRKAVLKRKGETEAKVRGRRQRGTENTRVTIKGNKEKEQKRRVKCYITPQQGLDDLTSKRGNKREGSEARVQGKTRNNKTFTN